MRLRYHIALWILRRLNAGERTDLGKAIVERAGGFDRELIVVHAINAMGTDRLRRLWHRCGLLLNVAKDGHLDLGRTPSAPKAAPEKAPQ